MIQGNFAQTTSKPNKKLYTSKGLLFREYPQKKAVYHAGSEGHDTNGSGQPSSTLALPSKANV